MQFRRPQSNQKPIDISSHTPVILDAIVIGSGITAAFCHYLLNSLGQKVISIGPQFRAGNEPMKRETMSASAKQILKEFGLHSLAASPNLCLASDVVHRLQWAWGSSEIVSTHSLFQWQGSHLLVNSRKLAETIYNQITAKAGDIPLRLYELLSSEQIEKRDSQWLIKTKSGVWQTPWLVDASGRNSVIGEKFVSARPAYDHNMQAAYTTVSLPQKIPALVGAPFVASVPDGWMFVAQQLPHSNDPKSGSLHIGFHTSRENLSNMKGPIDLIKKISQIDLLPGKLRQVLQANLESTATSKEAPWVLRDASSFVRSPIARNGYIAIGDAAMTFDPLSSQGILNGLVTALGAAKVIDAFAHRAPEHGLSCQVEEERKEGLCDWYENHLRAARIQYLKRLAVQYCMETRWENLPFWKNMRQKLVFTSAPSNLQTTNSQSPYPFFHL